MLNLIVFLIFLFLPPLFYRVYGEVSFRCVFKFFSSDKNNNISCVNDTYKVFFWTLGLLLHLLLSWVLVFFGLTLSSGFVLSFILLTSLSFKEIKKHTAVKKISLLSTIDFSFVSFFTVVLALGVSIFDADKGIRTLWVNNYGDLPFHLGMIANMVFSNGMLQEYHIFPGKELSYPFLINFWSALLWSFSPDWKSLSFVFLFQWVLVWMGVFFLFRKRVYGILPWVLLFSGGSMPVFLSQIGVSVPGLEGQLSHNYLGRGYPVTVFLSTIWVTQRSSLLGLLVSASSLCLFFEMLAAGKLVSGDSREQKITYSLLLLIAFSLAVGLLCHFHIVGVGIAYLGAVLFLLALKNYGELQYKKTFFVFSLSVLCFSLPVLILYGSKSGMIEFPSVWMASTLRGSTLGWSYSFLPEWFQVSFMKHLMMWVLNLGIWIVIIPFILWASGVVFAIPLVLFFLLFNFLQLSVWEWDTLKAFIGLFVILISLQRHFGYSSLPLFFCFLISLAPSGFETLMIWSKGNYSVIYSESELKKVSEIRNETPPDTIIASAPLHKSVVTVAGRRQYVGYDGWLHSHAIEYSERRALNSNLKSLLACRKPDVCPDYVYKDPHDATFFNDLPGFLKMGQLSSTKVEGLYKLKSSELGE